MSWRSVSAMGASSRSTTGCSSAWLRRKMSNPGKDIIEVSRLHFRGEIHFGVLRPIDAFYRDRRNNGKDHPIIVTFDFPINVDGISNVRIPPQSVVWMLADIGGC